MHSTRRCLIFKIKYLSSARIKNCSLKMKTRARTCQERQMRWGRKLRALKWKIVRLGILKRNANYLKRLLRPRTQTVFQWCSKLLKIIRVQRKQRWLNSSPESNNWSSKLMKRTENMKRSWGHLDKSLRKSKKCTKERKGKQPNLNELQNSNKKWKPQNSITTNVLENWKTDTSIKSLKLKRIYLLNLLRLHRK